MINSEQSISRLIREVTGEPKCEQGVTKVCYILWIQVTSPSQQKMAGKIDLETTTRKKINILSLSYCTSNTCHA